MPVRLTEEHVRTFAEHLPKICEAMCNDEHYSYVDGEFKLQTTGTYHVARVYLSKKYISLYLTELHYVMYMFHVFIFSTNSCTMYLLKGHTKQTQLNQ